MIYFLLAAFIIPFTGILIGNLIMEFWNDIIKWLKNIMSCLGQLVTVITGLVIIFIVLGWLFKSCPGPDPDAANYDYDPGLRYWKY